MKNPIKTIRRKYIMMARLIYNRKLARLLTNRDFSVIASNCNGATLIHDLGRKFNSPFVNLWINPSDFIILLQNLPQYMDMELKFTSETGIDYPVGILGDIKIYFQHYNSEMEAYEKWNTRKSRINYNNLFIMFTDRDGCTYSDLLAFDRLSYKNKVVFVNKPYPEIRSAFYIKGFENEACVGQCNEFQYTYHKYYDQFDYIGWFNQGGR